VLLDRRHRAGVIKVADGVDEISGMSRPRQYVCRCTPAVIAVFYCLFVAHPAASEIYRWTDEQGNLHFTSDPNQVPSQYKKHTEVTVPMGNVIVSGEDDTRSSAERIEALQERSRRLMEQRPRPASRSNEPQQRARAPGPEPQKYRKDCRKRTKNGRCGRRRTKAWNKWNALRQKYESAEAH